jgi:TRAP-type C4-dicarboxylate transport system permease small subunit
MWTGVESELPLYMAIPVGGIGIFLFFKQKELHRRMTKGYRVSDEKLNFLKHYIS